MSTQNIFDLSDLWNDGATTFTGIGLNVTDTASASGSLLMDLQVGGVSRFSVAKGGQVLLPAGTTSSPTIDLTAGNPTKAGLFSAGSGVLSVALSNANHFQFSNSQGFMARANQSIGFSSSSPLTGTSTLDVVLARDAADTLAQRRTTTTQSWPQAYRIYGSYTDASNYERGKIAWESNVLRIGTEKAGTGSARALELQTDGVTRLTIGTDATVTTANDLNVGNHLYLNTAAAQRIYWSANLFLINNSAKTVLCFNGSTSSFPGLKRSTTSLQARLADDSAFTNIQGKLTTETAYTAGAPTATGYIVLYDSTGTAYKVPAEAL